MKVMSKNRHALAIYLRITYYVQKHLQQKSYIQTSTISITQNTRLTVALYIKWSCDECSEMLLPNINAISPIILISFIALYTEMQVLFTCRKNTNSFTVLYHHNG